MKIMFLNFRAKMLTREICLPDGQVVLLGIFVVIFRLLLGRSEGNFGIFGLSEGNFDFLGIGVDINPKFGLTEFWPKKLLELNLGVLNFKPKFSLSLKKLSKKLDDLVLISLS